MTDPAASVLKTTSVLKPHAAATSVPRRTWIALAILLAGVAMSMIDNSIVNVALPTIRTSLDSATGGASEATLSWIISGYALAFGLALIPAGRIGDRIGHKWVFLVGLAGFTIASLACGLSNDSTQLIIARVAQGLFGGIFFPAVTALIQLMFPPRVRAKAFAVLGVVIGVSTAAGPLVGGLLIQALGDQDGWRSIFFVNIPIGVIAVVAALFFVPSGAEAHGKSGLDLIGVLLLAGSLVAILVPLIQGQDEGWPLWTYLSLSAGVVLLAVFALWERGVASRGAFPVVPPRLFSHASFTGGTILALVFFAAFTSIFFTISIMWQAGLGHSALESGLVTMPFALGVLVGATLGSRLTDRLGRNVLSLGTGLVALGLIGTWLVVLLVPAADLTNWELLGPLALGGIGSGFFIAPNAQFIVATVDRTEAGAASGVVGTAQRVGSAIGIAVIGSVLFGTLDITSSVAGPPTPADIATGFTHAATFALGTSAAFAVAAFFLVFALPKKVAAYGAPPAVTAD
ncbi:MAG: MFS transporter [Pseudolysinimonas sp.]|uniref:MFS transporter n=1 Tax=Pseudolysinimonas sp. TaxID=2680009 RepID=UPI003266A31F